MKQKISNKNIFYLVIFFVFCIFLFVGFSLFKRQAVDKSDFEKNKITKIKIANQIFEVELATSKREHYLGLSGREDLLDKHGMLFMFPEKEQKYFVMRDMNFSLDIVFIDENRVIDVYKNLPYDEKSQQILYESSAPVNKVLELKGGSCDRYNILPGSLVEIF